MSGHGLLPGWLAIVCGAIACSSTVPESQYPPPPPRDGLPFIPFAEENEFSEGAEAGAEPLPPQSTGPTPIDGALPDAPSFSSARKSACTNKQCELKAWLPDPGFAKSVPAGEPSPAALWAHEIAGGSTLILPRHHALEVLAVVLQGGVLAQGDDGGARKLALWDALRVPGAGVSLKADKGGAKLVLAIASSKGTLTDALDHAKAKPWEVRWKKRPGAIASTSLKDAKDLAWGKGAFHARIAFGGEYQTPASLETLLAGPDAAIAEHDHPTWEHIAILEGAGVMKLAGADHEVSPGSIFHIPKGVRHAFAPSGSSRLLAVQIYTPSGPEQRFIKLSAEDAKPPPQPPKQ